MTKLLDTDKIPINIEQMQRTRVDRVISRPAI